MTTEAKTERPAVPIRPPIEASAAIYRDLAVVPDGARAVHHKPSLREIQKELADLKGHLERIIGQVKTLSDSLNATLNG